MVDGLDHDGRPTLTSDSESTQLTNEAAGPRVPAAPGEKRQGALRQGTRVPARDARRSAARSWCKRRIDPGVASQRRAGRPCRRPHTAAQRCMLSRDGARFPGLQERSRAGRWRRAGDAANAGRSLARESYKIGRFRQLRVGPVGICESAEAMPRCNGDTRSDPGAGLDHVAGLCAAGGHAGRTLRAGRGVIHSPGFFLETAQVGAGRRSKTPTRASGSKAWGAAGRLQYGAGTVANSRRRGRIETIATRPGRCR